MTTTILGQYKAREAIARSGDKLALRYLALAVHRRTKNCLFSADARAIVDAALDGIWRRLDTEMRLLLYTAGAASWDREDTSAVPAFSSGGAAS